MGPWGTHPVASHPTPQRGGLGRWGFAGCALPPLRRTIGVHTVAMHIVHWCRGGVGGSRRVIAPPSHLSLGLRCIEPHSRLVPGISAGAGVGRLEPQASPRHGASHCGQTRGQGPGGGSQTTQLILQRYRRGGDMLRPNSARLSWQEMPRRRLSPAAASMLRALPPDHRHMPPRRLPAPTVLAQLLNCLPSGPCSGLVG